MFKSLSQMASLMRGAGEISKKLEALTQKLQSQRVVGSAGGDMVRVEMNGLSQVTRVEIDPLLLDNADREMLENLLPAAINQAAEKAKQLHVAAMGELTGGIDLPGFQQLLSPFSETPDPESPGTP